MLGAVSRTLRTLFLFLAGVTLFGDAALAQQLCEPAIRTTASVDRNETRFKFNDSRDGFGGEIIYVCVSSRPLLNPRTNCSSRVSHDFTVREEEDGFTLVNNREQLQYVTIEYNVERNGQPICKGAAANEPVNARPRQVSGGGGLTSESLCSFSSDISGFCGGGIDPIVLDLGPPGLDLTGLDDPVRFDIDADGVIEEVSWTARDAPDAFLVLDRNGNGTIDDGMELFGDAVMLRDGSVSENGYQALWEFDLEEFGGDGSGVIDANDQVFKRLRLWVDANHNGISEPRELRPLWSEGIVALSLQTERIMELDEHGNFFGLISRAYAFERQRGSVRRKFVEIPAIDVFFLVSPN